MIADVQDNHLPFHEACALFEKQYIQKTLDECRGSVAKAANVLGIHRSLLYKKIAKLGISRTD
ncbi:MAG: helix-turn-helix domain-containing protein [Coprococcus sp.]